MLTWILALYFGGIVLLLLEFILPGLVCGVVGSLMLLGSIGLGLRTYPEHAALIVFGGIVTAMTLIVVGMWLLPRLGYRTGLMLQKNQNPEEGYVNAPDRTELLDREGVVFSALRPAGAILLGDERLDAVSQGEFIDKDRRVRVVAVEGNRIVVEAI